MSDGQNSEPGYTGESGSNINPDTWREMLSPDLREGVEKFKSADDLVKSYQGLERMIGSRIPIPGENAGDEVRNEFYEKVAKIPGVMRVPDADNMDAMNDFYTKMGRPADADGYKYDLGQLPEGLSINEDLEKSFRQFAHSSGFSNKQVGEFMHWWTDIQKQALETEKGAYSEAEKTLKSKWGADYDRRLSAVNALLKQHLGEDAAQELYKSGLGNNLHLAEMLSNIAMNTLEDSVINARTAPALTPREIESQLDEIMSNPAYLNKFDPMHSSLIKKSEELYKKLYATG